MAVPVGGTPERPTVSPPVPRALDTSKRLAQGVRPAQLIPRSQVNQVREVFKNSSSID